jgi:hypothetical protein
LARDPVVESELDIDDPRAWSSGEIPAYLLDLPRPAQLQARRPVQDLSDLSSLPPHVSYSSV